MWTLLDNTKTDRPERRTALAAKELVHYKVDIAVLSETCLLDEGQLIEWSCGYTFFWTGCSDEEQRELDVGFVFKSQIIWKLANLSKGISDWLMSYKGHVQSRLLDRPQADSVKCARAQSISECVDAGQLNVPP